MTRTTSDNSTSLDRDPGAAFGLEDTQGPGLLRRMAYLLAEFRHLELKTLIPIAAVVTGHFYRKKAVQWVLMFGLIPLLLFHIHLQIGFAPSKMIGCIEFYFCLFWALYFYQVIQPGSGMLWRSVGYALFTAVFGVMILVAVNQLPVVSDVLRGTESSSWLIRFLGFFVGVGVLEEVCKALPLLWFGLRKDSISSVSVGAYLGLASGLGFAAAEGIEYTIYSAARAQAYGTVSDQFIQFLFRLMSGPLLHGAWAGIVGWLIGYAVASKQKRWPIITVGILFAAFLHGLYDVMISSPLGIPIAGLTFVVFLAYLAQSATVTKTVGSRPAAAIATTSTPGNTEAMAPQTASSNDPAANTKTLATYDVNHVIHPHPVIDRNEK